MALLVHIIDELKLGGAQTHLLTVLREMVKLGDYQHQVWTLFEDGPLGEQFENIGIGVKVLNLRSYFRARRFFAAATRIQEELIRSEPDLVEAHLTWSRLLGLWAAWRAGVPRRIGFEHGDIYLDGIAFRVANFAGQLVADEIVVCSDALSDWVRRTHHISKRKLTVLHNCVNTQRFHPAKRRPRSPDWPDVKTLFVAVGTLGVGVNKRMDVCIKAVEKARHRGTDAGLLICGDGEQRADLEALIRRLKLRSAVKILGLRNDVHTIMPSCDAFCHAAPFEPFGIVAVEAMASGLPVLVPDQGGICEAVEHGATGWTYPALEDGALADLMVQLSSNIEHRLEMGNRARQAALKRFSVSRYVTRLKRLYALKADENTSKPPVPRSADLRAHKS